MENGKWKMEDGKAIEPIAKSRPDAPGCEIDLFFRKSAGREHQRCSAK